nr:uncharacterized protein LOC119187100 [Rhipicephalus microplus]
MPDLGRVHRFRDHAVAGVNWRPTRFVDDVPSLLVCDLCRMIPERMLALPCAHTLCQSCHAANYSGGCCPLDQEPFEEAKLFVLHFPTTKFNALKVHCWNEAHGCQYEGAVEDMLRHYENECGFHAVECMRCGEEVLHRELSTHYVTGCSTSASPALTENISSESRALTFRDVTAALEQLKALLRDANHEQLLLGIQSRLDELTEHIRSRDSRSSVIQHDVAAPATSEAAQVAVPSHSTSSQRETSRDNHRVEASTSSPSSGSETVRTSGKMGYFTNLPVAVLKDMRKLSSGDYPQYAVTDRGPWNLYCHVELLSKQSRYRPTWRGMHGGVRYELAIENIHERMLSQRDSRIISKLPHAVLLALLALALAASAQQAAPASEALANESEHAPHINTAARGLGRFNPGYGVLVRGFHAKSGRRVLLGSHGIVYGNGVHGGSHRRDYGHEQTYGDRHNFGFLLNAGANHDYQQGRSGSAYENRDHGSGGNGYDVDYRGGFLG